MSYSNVRSKLSRAIAAYLISAGCGTAVDTSASNVTSDSTYPRTTVKSGIATPEVPMSGIYRIRVMISVKGSAANSFDNADMRVAFDNRVAAVYDAMMQSSDGTANEITTAGRAIRTTTGNSDMADFTCMSLYDGGFGEGEASEEGTAWEEILIFDAVCCASALT